MNIKPPCHNCTERYVGCHGKCQVYGEYRANLTDMNERRFKLKEEERKANACLSSATKMRMYRGW